MSEPTATAEHLALRASVARVIDEYINPQVDAWEAQKIFPAHALFRRLAHATQAPRWNFHKYLITDQGIVDFPSSVTPDAPELKAAIERALGL